MPRSQAAFNPRTVTALPLANAAILITWRLASVTGANRVFVRFVTKRAIDA